MSRISIKSTTGGTRTRNPRLTRHFTQVEVHRLGGRCLIHWATVALSHLGSLPRLRTSLQHDDPVSRPFAAVYVLSSHVISVQEVAELPAVWSQI